MHSNVHRCLFVPCQVKVWETDDITELVRTRYPAYLPLWNAILDKENDMGNVWCADAGQYFILHAFGGVTNDADMFYCGDPRAIYRWYEFYGVSLPSYNEYVGQIHNGAFAAPYPGHPFFGHLLRGMLRDLRVDPTTDAKGFDIPHVLYATGPYRMTTAVREYGEMFNSSYPDLCTGQIPEHTSYTWSVYPDFQFTDRENTLLQHFSFRSWIKTGPSNQIERCQDDESCAGLFQKISDRCHRTIAHYKVISGQP